MIRSWRSNEAALERTASALLISIEEQLRLARLGAKAALHAASL